MLKGGGISLQNPGEADSGLVGPTHVIEDLHSTYVTSISQGLLKVLQLETYPLIGHL
jgi:hypothetical protein